MPEPGTRKYVRRRENTWENARAVDGVNRAHIQSNPVRMSCVRSKTCERTAWVLRGPLKNGSQFAALMELNHARAFATAAR
jgi:hypothetical protein